MKKLTFIIAIVILYSCKKPEPAAPTTPTNTSEYIDFSLTREWDNIGWQLDNPPLPIMYDTILSTSYFQINGGNKIYLPTLSCISDTSSVTQSRYEDYEDTFAVKSGDVITFCINMKHRWDWDTAWNTWGTWINVYQYGFPYGAEQHLTGSFNSLPTSLGGKGEGLDEGICDGDTLSQTMSYTVQ